MLGGWQAQWAEQGLGVWWNVPKFCSLLLLPGSLTPLHSCCTTFPFQSIQIYPNKRWLQSEMSTHSGSWAGEGGDLWSHPHLCQIGGEGEDVLAVGVRQWYWERMDSKECTKSTEGSIPGPSLPFWESSRSSQTPPALRLVLY